MLRFGAARLPACGHARQPARRRVRFLVAVPATRLAPWPMWSAACGTAAGAGEVRMPLAGSLALLIHAHRRLRG